MKHKILLPFALALSLLYAGCATTGTGGQTLRALKGTAHGIIATTIDILAIKNPALAPLAPAVKRAVDAAFEASDPTTIGAEIDTIIADMIEDPELQRKVREKIVEELTSDVEGVTAAMPGQAAFNERLAAQVKARHSF